MTAASPGVVAHFIEADTTGARRSIYTPWRTP